MIHSKRHRWGSHQEQAGLADEPFESFQSSSPCSPRTGIIFFSTKQDAKWILALARPHRESSLCAAPIAQRRQWHRANSFGNSATNLLTISLYCPNHVTTAKWACWSCRSFPCQPPLSGWWLRVASFHRCLTWISHPAMGSSKRLDKEIPNDLAAAHAASAEISGTSSAASTSSSSSTCSSASPSSATAAIFSVPSSCSSLFLFFATSNSEQLIHFLLLRL